MQPSMDEEKVLMQEARAQSAAELVQI